MSPDVLTREPLDRLLVSVGSPLVPLTCAEHPKSGVDVLYAAGRVRLLCRECGFEAMQVKVAEAQR